LTHQKVKISDMLSKARNLQIEQFKQAFGEQVVNSH